MLSGNKGRLLRASNSMNTLKRRLGGRPQYTTATEPHARRRWRPGAPAAARRGPSRRRSDLAGLYESMLLSLSSCASVSHCDDTRPTTTRPARRAGCVRVLSSEFRAFEWVTAGGA